MILCNARLREPIHYLPTCWINPLVCPGCVLHIAVSHGCSTLITYCQLHGCANPVIELCQRLSYVYISSSSFYQYYRREH